MSSDDIGQATGFRLRITAGHDVGVSLTLVRRQMTVGKSSETDFPINDICWSRRHFAINWLADRNQHALEVLPSRNKLLVNGKQYEVSQIIELALGDRIRLGGTELVFERSDGDDGADEPMIIQKTP